MFLSECLQNLGSFGGTYGYAGKCGGSSILDSVLWAAPWRFNTCIPRPCDPPLVLLYIGNIFFAIIRSETQTSPRLVSTRLQMFVVRTKFPWVPVGPAYRIERRFHDNRAEYGIVCMWLILQLCGRSGPTGCTDGTFLNNQGSLPTQPRAQISTTRTVIWDRSIVTGPPEVKCRCEKEPPAVDHPRGALEYECITTDYTLELIPR